MGLEQRYRPLWVVGVNRRPGPEASVSPKPACPQQRWDLGGPYIPQTQALLHTGPKGFTLPLNLG